jgi:hypothetical protein
LFLVCGYIVRLRISAAGDSSAEALPQAPEKEEAATFTRGSVEKALREFAGTVWQEGKKTVTQTMERLAAASQADKVGLRTQGLRTQETQYLRARKEVMYPMFQRLFEKESLDGNPNNVPGIAIALSGKGFTGLVWSLGYLQALEKTGMLHATQYIAAGSTVTWLVSSWMTSERLLDHISYDIVQFVQSGIFTDLQNISIDKNAILNQIKDQIQSFVFDLVWPQYWFDGKIQEVDFLGIIPMTFMFDHVQPLKRYTTTLGSQWDYIQAGQKPFPIYTAVTGSKKEYTWWEFTPLEIKNIQSIDAPISYSMPEWAFNRTWNKGWSVPIRHEYGSKDTSSGSMMVDLYQPGPKLSTLLGMFSSSIEIDLVKLMQAVVAELYSKQYSDTSEKIMALTVRGVLDKMVKELAKKYEIGGSFKETYKLTAHNPFKNLDNFNSPLVAFDSLYFRDSSEAHSISALPLLRPDRRLHLVLVLETPEDKENTISSIDRFIADAAKMGVSYKIMNDKTTGKPLGNTTCSVYEDDLKVAPRILYIQYPKSKNGVSFDTFDQNFIDAATALAEIDPNFKPLYQKIMGRIGNLSILNKNIYAAYSPKTYDEQKEFAEFLVWANWNFIYEQLTDVMLERKIGFTKPYINKLYQHENELEQGGIF